MEEYFNTIKEYLIKKLDPHLIIIFGSAIRGEMNDESDIDVGFLNEQKNDPYRIFLLSQELANIVGKDIDLVDMSKSSTVMQVQIISSGKIIYNANYVKSAAFMMKSFKQYAMLNEERKCILDKINERGSIYAK